MNITYTGKQQKFYPAQTEKIEARFAKLAKVLDGRGEKSAHVILANSRGVHSVEITVNYLDHALVGAATDADQFTAITSALDKLEKQILKLRTKRQDAKKGSRQDWAAEESPRSAARVALAFPETAPPASVDNKKVFRVNHTATRKPMTLDEAMLELERDGDYVVYRDADKNCVSVLLRRPDGHFDLIES
jgi:putative sigma-54 modulation protein